MKPDHKAALVDAKYLAECRGNQQILIFFIVLELWR